MICSKDREMSLDCTCIALVTEFKSKPSEGTGESSVAIYSSCMQLVSVETICCWGA
jgi:hypothetical protein